MLFYDRISNPCLKEKPVKKPSPDGLLGLFILFILLQVADGVLTYYGMFYTREGIDYEANGLLLFYMQRIGITEALIKFKLLAITLGAALYHYRNRRTALILFVLNIFYSYTLFHHIRALNILLSNQYY